MSSINTIEKVFETTFTNSFKEFWKSFLEEKVCILSVFNHGDFYILNDLAIAELNTEQRDINLQNELDKVRKLIEKRPALHDFVPFAASGLTDVFYYFLAFKKVNGVISDDSIYRIWCFMDSVPEVINIKKIASKYSDILGNEMHIQSILYSNQSADDKLILKASDNIYSHVFDRYVFLSGYLDTVARDLNDLFSLFDDIKFFDEKGHTLYYVSAAGKSVILDTGDEVMQSLAEMRSAAEPTEIIFNNLHKLLAGKLGEYSLYRFQWNFYRNDIAAIGFGLAKNKNLEPLLDRYGMLFNNYTNNHDLI